MVEDPEEEQKQENPQPTEPPTETEKPGADRGVEQAQEPAGAGAPATPQPDQGERLSEFRRTLEEQEAADAAARAKAAKKPGIVRRMTGFLGHPAARQEPGAAAPTKPAQTPVEAGSEPSWSEIELPVPAAGAEVPQETAGEPEAETGPAEPAEKPGEAALSASEEEAETAAEEPPSPAGGLLAGLEEGGETPAEAPASQAPAEGSAPVAPGPGRTSPLRRIVTGFLTPLGKRKKPEEPEGMPSEQIMERLQPEAGGQGESAPSPTPGAGEAKAEPGSEGRALWGPYADLAAPASESPEAKAAGEGAGESQPAVAPFIDESPWLGELRSEMIEDEDRSKPATEPSEEQPPEAADLFDRLQVEQNRVDESGAPGEETQAQAAGVEEMPNEPATEGSGVLPKDFWSELEREREADQNAAWQGDHATGQPASAGEAPLEGAEETPGFPEAIPQDQPADGLRTLVLGEEGAGAEAPVVEAPEEVVKPRPWYRRLSPLQIGLISLIVVLLITVIGVAAFSLFPRQVAQLPIVAPPTVEPTQTLVPSTPYPIGIELTGGWIFSLGHNTLVDGKWVPQGGEWLDGSVVRRVVAIPWSRQTEAVFQSFQKGDTIRLYFSNKQIITYKVSQVEQVAVNDTSILSDTHPSLVVILYQTGAATRWVIIATQ